MQSPKILTEGRYHQSELDDLKKISWKFKDIYKSQLTELFEITNAHLLGQASFDEKLNQFLEERTSPNPDLSGNYVYYPWSGLLLHSVSQEELEALRTNRTSHLVSREEQKKLGQFTAAIAGLSFGNGIALSLVYSGVSNSIKVADKDIFETTNLNRVRVGLKSVNEPKVDVTAQEIYEINPYADVHSFPNGLHEENISTFINGDPKTNIIFDVVDDFSMKIRIRQEAKKAGVPVVMLTSLEDSVLVDIERYDLDPNADIFHGLLGSAVEDMLTKQMSESEKAQYAMRIVGPESISYRNLLSLSEVGSTLVSRPHLYGTVSIVCGLAAFIAKRIALGEDLPSMRSLVKFNEVLGILPNSDDTEEARGQIMSKLLKRAEQ